MNEPNVNPAAPAFPPPPAPSAAAPPAPPVAYAAPYVYPVKSPAVAGLLSCLPGLGHVYLGMYKRAAIFFGVWVLIIAVVSDVGGPIGFAIPFWWFFVLIDAVRMAQAINKTMQPETILPEDFQLRASGGSLALGVFLILFGAFFLLKKLVVIDLSFLLDWWPLLLVLFGAWQVFAHFQSKQASEKRTDEPIL